MSKDKDVGCVCSEGVWVEKDFFDWFVFIFGTLGGTLVVVGLGSLVSGFVIESDGALKNLSVRGVIYSVKTDRLDSLGRRLLGFFPKKGVR